jgi:prevent-host-death family protein
MPQIEAREARTHLRKLLERVQTGERFTITKQGRPVAELLPYCGNDAERALAKMRSVRKALARRGVRLKDLLKRGESLRDLANEDHCG